MTGHSLRFGSFVLDLERLCLEGTSGPVDLRPKSFDVLRYLVEHPGRVVSKEELIGAVWPNVTVSDESLTQCITEVRRALGDDNKRIIKTIRRRGYLVDVPVSAAVLVPPRVLLKPQAPPLPQSVRHPVISPRCIWPVIWKTN